MGTCRAAESSRGTALVVEIAAITRPTSFAGATSAIHRRNVGRDTRVRPSLLAVPSRTGMSAIDPFKFAEQITYHP